MAKYIIKKLEYNWYPPHQTMDFPDGCSTAEVGVDGVTRIEEHECMAPYDRWFYDIYKEDGSRIRVFNPNKVISVTE